MIAEQAGSVNPHPNVRFWLKADILQASDLCPLYPRKRTFVAHDDPLIPGNASGFFCVAAIIAVGVWRWNQVALKRFKNILESAFDPFVAPRIGKDLDDELQLAVKPFQVPTAVTVDEISGVRDLQSVMRYAVVATGRTPSGACRQSANRHLMSPLPISTWLYSQRQ